MCTSDTRSRSRKSLGGSCHRHDDHDTQLQPPFPCRCCLPFHHYLHEFTMPRLGGDEPTSRSGNSRRNAPAMAYANNARSRFPISNVLLLLFVSLILRNTFFHVSFLISMGWGLSFNFLFGLAVQSGRRREKDSAARQFPRRRGERISSESDSFPVKYSIVMFTICFL